MAAHFTPAEDGGVLCCCDGRQLPHACGVLTHLQAGGLGQAGRAGQTRRQPPAAGLIPEALPESARAATWGILATRHVHAGVPTCPGSGCAAGRCCAAGQAGCMCKQQVWWGMPLTFILYVRWALFSRRLSAAFSGMEGLDNDVRTDL